jgi:hypothetical protein
VVEVVVPELPGLVGFWGFWGSLLAMVALQPLNRNGSRDAENERSTRRKDGMGEGLLSG